MGWRDLPRYTPSGKLPAAPPQVTPPRRHSPQRAAVPSGDPRREPPAGADGPFSPLTSTVSPQSHGSGLPPLRRRFRGHRGVPLPLPGAAQAPPPASPPPRPRAGALCSPRSGSPSPRRPPGLSPRPAPAAPLSSVAGDSQPAAGPRPLLSRPRHIRPSGEESRFTRSGRARRPALLLSGRIRPRSPRTGTHAAPPCRSPFPPAKPVPPAGPLPASTLPRLPSAQTCPSAPRLTPRFQGRRSLPQCLHPATPRSHRSLSQPD